MKVKVIRRYVDRHTKEFMEVGHVCEYGQERAGELIDGGYVEAVRESRAANRKEESKDD